MKLSEIIIIAIGLAMDAFAVSVCKGLAMRKMSMKKAVIIATYFGVYQAVMPVIGYLLGMQFKSVIENIDHWIAFILLGIIGINMIKEAVSNNSESVSDNVEFKEMSVLAIATSIDALAVGVTFAFLGGGIIRETCIVGIITFVICIIGVKIGNVFGNKFEKKSRNLWWCYFNTNGYKNIIRAFKYIVIRWNI